MITREKLNTLFEYNSNTFTIGNVLVSGVLIAKTPSNRLAPRIIETGLAIIGTWGYHGSALYCRVNIGGRLYYLHRLIWIYHFGAIQNGIEIDHKSTITTDCRITNLRQASPWQNRMNRNGHSNSVSKYIGVSLAKSGKFRSRVMLDRVEHNSGEWDCEHLAALSRDKLAVKLFGEFAKLNFPELF